MGIKAIIGIGGIVLVFGALYVRSRRAEDRREELEETFEKLARQHEGLESVGDSEKPTLEGSYEGIPCRASYHFEQSHSGDGMSTHHTVVQSAIESELPDGFEIRTEGWIDLLPIRSPRAKVTLTDPSSDTTLVVRADSEAALEGFSEDSTATRDLLEAFETYPELEIYRNELPTEARRAVPVDQLPVVARSEGRANLKTRGVDASIDTVRAKLEVVAQAARAADECLATGTPSGEASDAQW